MPKILIIYLLLNIFFINSTTYTTTYTSYKNIKKYILRGENKTTNTFTPHNSFKSYNLTDENQTLFFV